MSSTPPAHGASGSGGHPAPHRALGVLAITVTAVLWGTTGTAATFAPDVGPLAIGAAALGIGGLLQAAIALGPLRAARPALREHRGALLQGGAAVAVYPLAFYGSMHLAGVAIGSVVSLASAPLAAGVLRRLVDRRPLGRSWMVAAGVGILGSVLLCAARLGDATAAAAPTAAGIALGLLAGTTYALYSRVAHELMASGIGRRAAMGAVFGLGGLALMPVLLITGAPILADGRSLAVAAYMAVVPMFLGYVLFGIGLASVDAGTATTITLLEPAVATLLAVVVVGEHLGPVGWLGMVLLIGVVALLAVSSAPRGDPGTRHPHDLA